MNSYKNSRASLCSLLLYQMAGPVAAAGVTAATVPTWVDTSRWECEYCVIEQGWSGELEAGAGNVSETSAKFGEYNGLDDDGSYLLGNAMARYRDAGGRYLDLRIRDLGLDNRSVSVEGGRQGRYDLSLDYDEIQHAVSDSVRTPYLGNGGDTLTLPPGWVRAGSTAGMTELADSLHDVDLSTRRKRLGIGLSFIPASRWETSIDVRHELRDGMKRSAGAFAISSAQLIEPVDYVTDEVEVAVSHSYGNWNSRLAYYGSFFNNRDAALTWQNAYTSNSGADEGQRALPPDNRFHQLLLSSGYRVSDRTRISGDIALGRMEQDESLLDASVNPAFSDVELPRPKAQARVDTVTANLRANTAVNDRLRLNAAYRYNDRDNRTPSDVFDWVTTDVSDSPLPRSNLPYSFTDHTASVGGDYRLDSRTRLSGGYEYELRQRTNQEVRDSTEHTGWGRVSTRRFDKVDLTLRYAHAERDIGSYNPVDETEPAQNPLLKKYNMADRVRDTGSINAGFTPHERVTLGLGVEMSLDDYTDSVLGLKNSKEFAFTADAALSLGDRTSLHAFANRQSIESEQTGSQSYATPDWHAGNDDIVNSFGIGAKHTLVENRLDIGADYVLSRSRGEISLDTGAGDFPDLESDLDTLKLYADYRLKDNTTLHAAYWYERYETSDWMLDGVAPATIPTVLGFGESSPDYDVHTVMLSLRYRF